MLLSGERLVLYLAFLKFAVHLGVQNYGFFRDEMYFLACGDRLDWGYVDHPPLVAVLARISVMLFGRSLVGIHVLPALAGAAQVVLAGMLVREFGGKRFAQVLAATATAVAPIYLSLDGYLSMNCLEPVLWTLLAYVVVRIVNTGQQRGWLLYGVIAGIGLQNKYGISVFAGSMVLGVLLTEERKAFRSPWLWLGAALAMLIFLPNLLWQRAHGFPFLEMQKQFVHGKNVILSPLDFLVAQVQIMNPATLPLWLGGICFFFTRRGRPWRALGWTWLLALLFFLTQKGTKMYFLAPAYIMLFASGAVFFEEFIASISAPGRRLQWLKPAYLGLVLAVGALYAPLVICVLPPRQFVAYVKTFGLSMPTTERHSQGPLPMMYADMFGWPEMVEKVATYYNSLPVEERTKTAILGGDYGDCGAIDLFGPQHGLPKAIGPHMNYWIWGPRDYTGESIIVVGGDVNLLTQRFESLEKVADLDHPYAMPYENRPIWHCRRPKFDLQKVWPQLKSY